MGKIRYWGRVVAKNAKSILSKTWVYSGTLFAIASTVLSFVTWDDLGVSDVIIRIIILLGLLLLSLLFAVFCVCFINTSKIIWEHGNSSINLMFGDIIKMAFPSRKAKSNYAVVIPMNNDFDTSFEHGLIAPMSIHGQWISNMLKSCRDTNTLYNRIRYSASQKPPIQTTTVSRTEKPYGNTERYPLGTVIAMEQPQSNITFYLLALTQLDKDLTAHCSIEECISSLQSLIDFHNVHGQGSDLYIPLVGTGLSRTRLTHKDSVELITSVCKLKQENVHCNVNIVIRDTERDHITLSDF